jgi:hypothetical protein
MGLIWTTGRQQTLRAHRQEKTGCEATAAMLLISPSALIKLTIPKLYQQHTKDAEEKAKLPITPGLPLRRKLKS